MINVTKLDETTLDDSIEAGKFDLFIGFLCNEARSIHVLKRTHKNCTTRIMFTDPRSNAVPINAQHARWAKKSRQIELIYENDDLNSDVLEEQISDALADIGDNKSVLSIMLDISSMPRNVVASIMATIADATSSQIIQMTVAYCLAKYTPPLEHNLANKTVRPVHQSFTGFSTDAGLPVAAIVGLGYEKDKALGAVEYIQSSDWWVFVPTSEETKYLKKVEQHNKTILNVVGEERRFAYSVHSPLFTTSQLDSLVSSLVHTHKPVLLPFGPKIFFFCALLVSLVHRQCAVWHVLGESPVSRADVSSSAHVMCLSFQLEEERAILKNNWQD